MTDRDKKRFAVAMNWLALKLAKDGEPTELTKEQLRDYFDALKNLTLFSVEKAVQNYFASATFRGFPLPGDIRKSVTETYSDCTPVPQLPAPTVPPEMQKQFSKDMQEAMKDMRSDITISDKIQLLRTLDRAYPNIGFGDGLDILEQQLTKVQEANNQRHLELLERRKSEWLNQ